MAEPIGITSGLLALATFAFQSSVSLYQLIESFQSSQRNVRQLKEELQALDGVLQSLQEAAANNSASLAELKLPLLRCGKACRDFKIMIVKCSAHSSGPRTSFRDWAKLRYMGSNIAGFKNMLAGYKSTISIALGCATLRTASITADVLKDYKEMVANTTNDLEEHLQEIEERLQTFSVQEFTVSEEDATERQEIQEEKESTKQCLTICAQVSEKVNEFLPQVFENVSVAQDVHQVVVSTSGDHGSAKRVTSNSLQKCQEMLTNTTSNLKEHLQAINRRLHSLSSSGVVSDEHTAERERVQEERDSVKQCLAICSQASEQVDKVRTNVFEDVSVAEDGNQLIVSTLGDLISAKGVRAGVRATQWLGQMSDTSLQQLSQSRGIEISGRMAKEKATEPQRETRAEFAAHYGAGHKLNSSD